MCHPGLRTEENARLRVGASPDHDLACSELCSAQVTADLRCCDRSMFQEEFRDAKGFGWSVNDSNPFNWEALIAKKVSTYW